MTAPTLCPRCGQDAPLLVQGIIGKCSACGAPRNPLSARAVNIAGRPSQVGGHIARVMGWVSLLGGAAIAIVIGAILQAVFPAGFAGWLVGGVILSIALVVALLLLLGGGKLRQRGEDVERETLRSAVFALAERSGGVLTAEQVAQALGMTPAAADAALTELAKVQDGRVALEVDDDGRLTYLFRPIAGLRVSPRQRVRVAPPASSGEPIEAELIDSETPARRRSPSA
jgi:hypothetical protein